jgi:hypothetical protein
VVCKVGLVLLWKHTVVRSARVYGIGCQEGLQPTAAADGLLVMLVLVQLTAGGAGAAAGAAAVRRACCCGAACASCRSC